MLEEVIGEGLIASEDIKKMKDEGITVEGYSAIFIIILEELKKTVK